MAVDFRPYSSLASLIVLLLEYILTCPSEYRYVWKTPRSNVKFIYLFSRYFGLISQCTDFLLLMTAKSRVPVEASICKAWFVSLFLCCSILLRALDTVIMLRVYALYNQSRTIAFVLIFISFLHLGYSGVISAQSYAHDFDGFCNMKGRHHEGAYMGAMVSAMHIFVWALAFSKRHIAFGQAPVVRMVVREGGWMFALIIAIMGITVPFSYVNNAVRGHIIFVWPSSLFSIAACRLIISMQKLKVENIGSGMASEFELTTDITVSIINVDGDLTMERNTCIK
ncbi:hypothetical protein BDQ12DRAFT_685556 [Crucibulum laeve]|uniref:DUF6533 domain-containing protein n=1 Tax=Crucibulum laeve TaxID=68775 RepID=A0A5C3LXH4_9AGAR|nr:hypothetical protein BDQ12DRAFT_685556 [Crucibulum laeve]